MFVWRVLFLLFLCCFVGRVKFAECFGVFGETVPGLLWDTSRCLLVVFSFFFFCGGEGKGSVSSSLRREGLAFVYVLCFFWGGGVEGVLCFFAWGPLLKCPFWGRRLLQGVRLCSRFKF